MRHSERAILQFFKEKGFRPLSFQREVWALMAERRSGLLHATTGAGKTLAVALGAWRALEDEDADALPVLWVTPMRALAADSARALTEAFDALARLDPKRSYWRVGLRTGDTPSAARARQDRTPPTLLITTPESLCLMLARPDAAARFAALRCVVVDEWHELIGEKRGVLTQLALARLRKWNPSLLVWGMSATLGNLEEAKRVLLGPSEEAKGALVCAHLKKRIAIDTLLPEAPERFPYSGRMGLKMVPQVASEIDGAANSLIFTNTRNQAEIWYQALLSARPNWAGLIALHHGSLERDTRDFVEAGLKNGSLKAVVCTSSLDLGVDFLPVERVLQIGSPKGVARILQRAGRSGHAPGRPSRITIVPSHSLEIVESAALQTALASGRIENRQPPVAPLDVLAQHLVTLGLGGGFLAPETYEEVRNTASYETLTPEDWRWCLDFIRQGGPVLGAYPQYRRCAPDALGVWRVADKDIALRHRMNIGAIAADASVLVRYGPVPPGRKLGSVEERFISRLRAGDKFWFAGKLLEFVTMSDLVAYVRKASGGRATTPRWDGGRMPLSTTLADAMIDCFTRAAAGVYEGVEMRAAKPMLETQKRWSKLPTNETLLLETLDDREGSSLFVYPFAGRNAHLGMASLFAWRASQAAPGVFSIAVNDYGFSLLSAAKRDWLADWPQLLRASDEGLDAEILEALGAAALARRRFRIIAQIAGLVAASSPGARKTARQLQSSSSLIYDVFRRYDPQNGLLGQADREALAEELEVARLQRYLRLMRSRELVAVRLKRCSPLAFPLMVERLRERLANEPLAARIERMTAQLESAAAA